MSLYVKYCKIAFYVIKVIIKNFYKKMSVISFGSLGRISYDNIVDRGVSKKSNKMGIKSENICF
jgi:hypothetical protein